MMAAKMSGDSDDGAPDGGDGSDDGYDDGLKAAVASFIEAVHSKDVDSAASALHDAMDLCTKAHGEPDGDEGDGAPSGHSALLLIPHGKH